MMNFVNTTKVVSLRGGPLHGEHRGVSEAHTKLHVTREGEDHPEWGEYRGSTESAMVWVFKGWYKDHTLINQRRLVARAIEQNESAEARDKGIAKVEANDPGFSEHVRIVLVRDFRPGTEVTSHDLREACESYGVIPRHHNGWGGAMMGCVRAGLLEDTGRVVRSKRKASHARKLTVYRRSLK